MSKLAEGILGIGIGMVILLLCTGISLMHERHTQRQAKRAVRHYFGMEDSDE